MTRKQFLAAAAALFGLGALHTQTAKAGKPVVTSRISYGNDRFPYRSGVNRYSSFKRSDVLQYWVVQATSPKARHEFMQKAPWWADTGMEMRARVLLRGGQEVTLWGRDVAAFNKWRALAP